MPEPLKSLGGTGIKVKCLNDWLHTAYQAWTCSVVTCSFRHRAALYLVPRTYPHATQMMPLWMFKFLVLYFFPLPHQYHFVNLSLRHYSNDGFNILLFCSWPYGKILIDFYCVHYMTLSLPCQWDFQGCFLILGVFERAYCYPLNVLLLMFILYKAREMMSNA